MTIATLLITPLSRVPCGTFLMARSRRNSRPEALRPRLAAGLPLHCEASKYSKERTGKVSATAHVAEQRPATAAFTRGT
jgi:hypothetical protein